jgi:uncharacterized protein with HEPN domain
LRPERVPALLDQLLVALRSTVSFIEGMSRDQFIADAKTRQAVIMNLVVVSELLARLASEDPGLPERFPDIPWRAIRGLRNRIVHDYYTVDLDIIFDTAARGVPELLDKLRRAGLEVPPPSDGDRA